MEVCFCAALISLLWQFLFYYSGDNIAECGLLWEESRQFKSETFTMDGDDDLFAVFDANENAEDEPAKPSSSGQVVLFDFLS